MPETSSAGSAGCQPLRDELEAPAASPQGTSGTLALHWYTVLLRGARQMCGIPDYQVYLAHHHRHHPDRPPLSYEAFFRQRIDIRYGSRNGNPRCC